MRICLYSKLYFLINIPPISKSPSFEVHIIQEGAPLFGDTLFTNPNYRYYLSMEI